MDQMFRILVPVLTITITTFTLLIPSFLPQQRSGLALHLASFALPWLLCLHLTIAIALGNTKLATPSYIFLSF